MRICTFVLISAILYCFAQAGPIVNVADKLEQTRADKLDQRSAVVEETSTTESVSSEVPTSERVEVTSTTESVSSEVPTSERVEVTSTTEAQLESTTVEVATEEAATEVSSVASGTEETVTGSVSETTTVTTTATTTITTTVETSTEETTAEPIEEKPSKKATDADKFERSDKIQLELVSKLEKKGTVNADKGFQAESRANLHKTSGANLDSTSGVERRGAEEIESLNSTTTTTTTPVPVIVESNSIVAEEPVSEFNISSICESTKNFNYYKAHPIDATKYIECDPWGTGSIRSCESGKVWNMWTLTCDLLENVRNVTFEIPQKIFNCSTVGYECMNGGMCTESTLGGYKCVCTSEYTGQFCESEVDTTDLTHEILNGTFSFAKYRASLAELNMTCNASQYLRYRDELDNTTFTELMSYINLYKDGEVRFDTSINQLVQNILEDIYPDAAYLSSFNASTISIVDLVRLIPNLLSYSRYSVERYQEVFAKYQSILIRLVEQLNSTGVEIRTEALGYSRLTSIFLNQTMALMNETLSHSQSVKTLIQSQGFEHTKMSESQIRTLLQEQFNGTLVVAQKLMKSFESFQIGVSQLLKNNTDVYRLTLDNCNIEGADVVKGLLQTVSVSSIQIWESLVNYGFWFVTTYLTVPVERNALIGGNQTQF